MLLNNSCFELIPKYYGVYVTTIEKLKTSGEYSHTFKAYLEEGVACLEGYISQDITFCTKCNEDFTILNSLCFINIVRKHGSCIQHPNILYDIRCVSCETGYKGRLCD